MGASGLFLFFSLALLGQVSNEATTTFRFGGYVKADFINTWYQNGDVGAESPLRDFHLPGQIPVGDPNRNFDLDYHVKESRFNFDIATSILGQNIHGFVELDFLLSKAGDEKVSNSFNPRLRHFYVEWNRLLIGQTWSTFMVVVVPDEIDFAGALEGLVFVRQPQIRYKAGNWWFSLENPETTVTPFQTGQVSVTDSEVLPDIIARRNFSGTWGNWSIAGIIRNHHQRDSLNHSAFAFGLTTGGKLIVGKKGDDIRIMATYGQGLGRYLAAGFIAGSAVEEQGDLNPIGSLNGYIAYNHFWVERKVSSSFSISAFQAFHPAQLVGPDANNIAYSLSGNLKYDPVPVLRLGLEYMYAFRELKDGTNGSFHRIQFAVKYQFGYTNAAALEKN